uniref:ACO2M n=1 Tax=Arundo donax TaxID=35708 RepID=A0A0A9ASL9_ARUDO
MNNARTRRYYKHVLKCRRSPFEAGKPLLVPLELQFHVGLHCTF